MIRSPSSPGFTFGFAPYFDRRRFVTEPTLYVAESFEEIETISGASVYCHTPLTLSRCPSSESFPSYAGSESLGMGDDPPSRSNSDPVTFRCLSDYTFESQNALIRHTKSGKLRGNNVFGRSGKMRCKQCRTWRIKCEYEEAEDPCKSCLKKGIQCGADDKVWGAKRQQRTQQDSHGSDKRLLVARRTSDFVAHSPDAPCDYSLNAFDGAHLQFFFEIMVPSFMEEKARTDGRRLSDIIYCRYGPTLNSNPIRAAILLLVYSFKNFGMVDSCQLFQYRQQSLQHTKNAALNEVFDELVYSCYALCIHGFISGQPFEEIIPHARAFLTSFQQLKKNSNLETEELFFLRCMCKDLFCWLTGFFGVYHSGKELSRISLLTRAEKMFELIRLTEPLFEGEMLYSDEPEWIRNSRSYMRTQMLIYRLQITFEYYLLKRDSGTVDILKNWLQPVLDTIRSAFRELDIIIAEDPRIIPLVDRAQLFRHSNLNEMTPMLPPSRVTKDFEWLYWKPALLAHYNYAYNRLVDSWGISLESVDINAIGTGMSICRMIDWDQNMANKFKVTNLSALRSLMLAFWWESGTNHPEGLHISPCC